MSPARADANRIVIVRDTPHAVQRPAAIKRYRLARVRLDDRASAGRFAHLKRAYD